MLDVDQLVRNIGIGTIIFLGILLFISNLFVVIKNVPNSTYLLIINTFVFIIGILIIFFSLKFNNLL